MKNIIKVYALLSAHSYPKRRYEEYNKGDERYMKYFKTTRKVDLNTNILKNYHMIDDLTTSKYTTYLNKKNKTIIFAVRGTDLTRLYENNDLYTDALLVFGKENKRPCYKCAYNNLRKILKRYPNYRVIITGHSLGGRLAINLLDSKLGDKIYQVHVFNSATAPVNLYNSASCYTETIADSKKKLCKNREKLHIHQINEDPISILSLGEKSKTRKIYPRKKKSCTKLLKGKNKTIKKSHSLMNFI